MSSVFSIFTQPCSQEGIKKDVLKFSTQHENVQCQFQARNQYFWGGGGGGEEGGIPREKLCLPFLAKSTYCYQETFAGEKTSSAKSQ